MESAPTGVAAVRGSRLTAVFPRLCRVGVHARRTLRCRRPAGSVLTVRVVDKNHGDTRLAEFGVEFAQENR